jgi:DNA modification methylase
MTYKLYLHDCLEWLDEQPEASFEAIITDPPYGLKEYSAEEQVKLRAGRGGVWRIPPALGGNVRAPLPRFTVLNRQDREELYTFFLVWGRKALRVAVPGAHLFIATNSS